MNFTAGNQYLADLLRGQTLSDADLNALVLFKIDTWWRRWRKRPSQTYIIPNPQLKGYPLNVPADLEPAKKWTGALRERLDILPDIHSGTYYTGVYASHRDKPYLKQIPKRKKKPPLKDAKQLS